MRAAGYEAARVFRIEHLLSWREKPSTKLSFWRGFRDLPPSLDTLDFIDAIDRE
jgi:hypothetical protein